MKYKVHRVKVNADNMQEKIGQYIKILNDKLISIIPNLRPKFQFMGARAKIDHLLVVERRK